MTYNQALKHIHGLHRFARKPELTRMHLLLEHLGNPQQKLRFVHVAGTNGKGSTAVMLSAILRRAGYHTGTYTSPFVVDFRERIVLDGQMISQKELAALTAEVAEAAALVEAALEAPREFEFITALALLYYSRKPCDIVVLEVGLGGRFDATNAIDPPLAAVICPIGLDHTELLGQTIREIAGEKCGIIKPGSLVVSSPSQSPEAMEVIAARCWETGCTLTVPQRTQLQVIQSGLGGSRFLYHGIPYQVTLAGTHQVYNAVTAIDTALTLAAAGVNIPTDAIAEGIREAAIPGRLEVFLGNEKRPTLLLDGAHNPHGMAALRDSLFAAGVQDITGVIGMLADKNCTDALDAVAPFLKELIITQPKNPRALPAPELAEMARHYCNRITIEPDSQKAVRLALGQCTGTVLVCGSLYLVSEVRPLLVTNKANQCV